MAKAKGTIVVPTVRFLRTKKDQARALLPSSLHAYLDDRLQVAQWYPEQDFLELLRCMAELLPGSGPGLFEQLGRAAAAEHMAGIYQHLGLDGSDPLSLARRSFALWSSMHDTGRLRIVEPAPDGATFLLEAFALPSRELCATVSGYFAEALRLAGLDAVVHKQRCVLDDADACAWRAQWSPPGGA